MASAAKAIMTGGRARSYAKPANEGSTDYAFEVSAANLRYGEGVTVRDTFHSAKQVETHMLDSEKSAWISQT